jgi:hypothetical protein
MNDDLCCSTAVMLRSKSSMTPPPKSFRFNDRAASIEVTTVGRPGRPILREIPVQLRACPSNARFQIASAPVPGTRMYSASSAHSCKTMFNSADF